MSTTVDSSSAVAIAAAIQKVKEGKGMSVLAWNLFRAVWKAPATGISIEELEFQYGVGTPNRHLGWFCNEVAKILGDNQPGDFALCSRSLDRDGKLFLSLKPSVAAAMDLLSTTAGREKVLQYRKQ